MGNKNVNKITFITGGCRSGKSTYALQLAERMLAEKSIFIATCVPQDEEMKQRVAKHQGQRSRNWITIEEPLRLPEWFDTAVIVLLGLGLRSFSVTPAAIPEIKQICRSVSIEHCRRVAQRTLQLDNVRDVKTYLNEELTRLPPELMQ